MLHYPGSPCYKPETRKGIPGHDTYPETPRRRRPRTDLRRGLRGDVHPVHQHRRRLLEGKHCFRLRKSRRTAARFRKERRIRHDVQGLGHVLQRARLGRPAGPAGGETGGTAETHLRARRRPEVHARTFLARRERLRPELVQRQHGGGRFRAPVFRHDARSLHYHPVHARRAEIQPGPLVLVFPVVPARLDEDQPGRTSSFRTRAT